MATSPRGTVGLQGLETRQSSKGILSEDSSSLTFQRRRWRPREGDISEGMYSICGPEGIPIRC